MKPLNEMTIALASDHAGFGLKSMIHLFLEREGAKVVDFGCNSMDNCDFPDFAHPMATAVEKGECDFGIGFCYTGNGMSMCANTHPHVRAVVCWETRMAENARRFFNANVLCLPAEPPLMPAANDMSVAIIIWLIPINTGLRMVNGFWKIDN